MKPRTRGFTLLELGIVLAVVGVLAVVFLNRLYFYQGMAEKAAMETTLRLVKTGLQIRLAELIATNRQDDARELESEDPTSWLKPKPANYAGSYMAQARPGNWYFDAQRRELVYVVNHGGRLVIDDGEDSRELRFQARLTKDRLKIGGATVDSVTGVTLAPVTRFRWSRAELIAILA